MPGIKTLFVVELNGALVNRALVYVQLMVPFGKFVLLIAAFMFTAMPSHTTAGPTMSVVRLMVGLNTSSMLMFSVALASGQPPLDTVHINVLLPVGRLLRVVVVDVAFPRLPAPLRLQVPVPFVAVPLMSMVVPAQVSNVLTLVIVAVGASCTLTVTLLLAGVQPGMVELTS